MSQYFGFPAGTQYPTQPAAAAAAAAAFQPPTVASAGYVQPAPAPAAAPAAAYSAAAASASRPGAASAYADPTAAYGAPAPTVVTPTAGAQSYNSYTVAAQAAVAAAAHAVVGRSTVPTGHTPAASAAAAVAAAAAAPTAAGLAAPNQPAPPGVPTVANSAVSQAAAVAAGYTAGYTSSAGGYPAVSVCAAGPGMQAVAGKSSISKTSYVVSPSSSATAANFAVASLPAGAAPTTSGSFSGYEAALYSAATSYYQQQHQQQQQQSLNAASLVAAVAGNQHAGNSNNKTIVGGSVPSQLPQSIVRNSGGRESGGGPRGGGMRRGGHGNYGGGGGGGGGGNGNVNSGVGAGRGNFHGRDQPVHYCEVCKISCAGPQTYKEHLEGQKHKKKEAALKAGQASSMRHGQKQLRCELCDVTCTGVDAYSAHIRGAKHLKTMKLHQRLGKPIPSNDPVVVKPAMGGSMSITGNANAGSVSAASANVSAGTTTAKNLPASSVSGPGAGTSKKVASTPKITFVGSSTLKSVGGSTKTADGSSACLDTSTSVSGSVATTTNTIMSYPANPTPTMRRSTGSVNIELTSGDTGTIVGTTTASGDVLERVDLMELQDKDQQQPVGYEYIEEISNEAGKVTQFHCKLCDCKFNDPNAKEMHLKGRRHRLQYKKKVDPSLEVDIKPNLRGRRVQEERMRRQQAREEFWRRRDMEERMREMQMMEWAGSIPPGGRPGMGMRGMMSMHGNGHMRGMTAGSPGGGLRRGETSDDKHVMAKHASVYPTEGDLQAVQHIVSSCEKALKLVSDEITNEDIQAANPESAQNEGDAPVEVKPDVAEVDGTATPTKTEMEDGDLPETKSAAANTQAPSTTPPQPVRILKGVMRVGVLAKGLLLHDCLRVDLVLLCSERPTVSILRRVATILPKHLNTVSLNRKYHVDILESQSCVRVRLDESEIPEKSDESPDANRDVKRKDGEPSADGEPRPVCFITLTNPNMRPDGNIPPADNSKIETSDLLDKDKCLAALASLRHAKWFQANASSLQSCVLIIRILRDLCTRVPTWSPLKSWALEVLAEKVISSDGTAMSPGDALRRLFECIASGLLLPGGVGVQDPCEKEPTDAAGNLTAQEREDITASAQHALRLIAFRQIHKVLDMDPLPPMHGGGTGATSAGTSGANVNRKRRLSGQESSANSGGEKKDKKET